jgi:hypothetical protein
VTCSCAPSWLNTSGGDSGLRHGKDCENRRGVRQRLGVI